MAQAVAAFGISSSTSSLPSLPLRPTPISRSQITFSLRSLPSQSHFPASGSLTHSNRHVCAAVVSSDSITAPITPELDSTGPGGGSSGNGKGFGGGGGGGGGGDGGGDSNKDEEEGSDGDERKMGLSMSQKLTLGYAALVGVGGVMGYLKSGSQKSLLAGGLSATLLYYVHTELPLRPVFASSLGLGISAALLGVMGSRFKKSGKVFPAGVVSFVSLIMTGGYLHGILRSAH